jgi:uncharacterized protein YkwD
LIRNSFFKEVEFMKKSVRVLSVAAAAALAFSMSATGVSAYCGLSAADLARANSYNSYYSNANECYTACPDCGKVSYGTECVYPECPSGDCYTSDCTTPDCTTPACDGYECNTAACDTPDCTTPDCTTPACDGYECDTSDCTTPDCTTPACDGDDCETPVTEIKTTYTPSRPTYTFDFGSWLSQIFSNSNSNYSGFDFGSLFQTPKATETPSAPVTPSAPSVPVTPSVPDYSVSDTSCSAYAREMLTMINEARAEVGAPALKLSSELCNAANIRAKEIASSFSHTRPDGSSFYTVLDDIGYSGSRSSGENIAAGYSSVSDTFEQWMNSPGHYENMMKSNYKYIGIGYYKSSSGYVYHWAQIFSY